MKSSPAIVWEFRVNGFLARSSFELLRLLHVVSQTCPAITCHVTWASEDSTEV